MASSYYAFYMYLVCNDGIYGLSIHKKTELFSISNWKVRLPWEWQTNNWEGTNRKNILKTSILKILWDIIKNILKI